MTKTELMETYTTEQLADMVVKLQEENKELKKKLEINRNIAFVSMSELIMNGIDENGKAIQHE